jgi:hypothetical protein
MSNPSLSWRAFHVPKKGHSEDEYEDAFAADQRRGRFAVADGASESSFAGEWARLLVKAYVKTPGPWSRWLPAARKRWRDRAESRDLPWYAESKMQDGAFAALLGLAFKGGRWRAESVGDSCLFVVRQDRLLRSFPMRSAGDFDNRPSLLGSQPRTSDQPLARRTRLHGDCRLGDIVYLMTDAMAQWFLERVEAKAQPWEVLRTLRSQKHFGEVVERLRSGGEMRNDDVTLVRIERHLSNEPNG